MQAVLLGAVLETDWTLQGVPANSKVETWTLSLPSPSGSKSTSDKRGVSLTGDGHFLYLHGYFGLLKLGTGFGNTVKVSYQISALSFSLSLLILCTFNITMLTGPDL